MAALRRWVRQAEHDTGQWPGLMTDERHRLKQLERENFELRRANEILRKASAFSRRRSSTGDRTEGGVHRRASKDVRVEPICRVLPSAPSTYFRHKAHEADPTRRSARAQRDDELCAIIRRIWTEHHQVYGPRKVWRQMGHEKLGAARCRVLPLMRKMGLTSATCGRAWVTTTHPFYTQLNQLLREHRFDDFAEAQCATFYADTMGRPSLPPGIYFRLLLIGYFEGIDSDRGIACAIMKPRQRGPRATDWPFSSP